MVVRKSNSAPKKNQVFKKKIIIHFFLNTRFTKLEILLILNKISNSEIKKWRMYNKIPLVKLQKWPISVQPKQKSIFILPQYALDWQALLAVMVSYHRSN
jgi:hypothetical protein